MSTLHTPFVNERMTVCECLRQIYYKIKETELAWECVPLLESAYRGAKRMDTKLMQYKYNYDKHWYETNKHGDLKDERNF